MATATASAQPVSQAQLWFRALRAPFLVASVLPVILGGILAWVFLARPGVVVAFNVPLFLLTLVGAVFVHLATNMLNDNFDYRSGNDLAVDHKNPFAGGGRVLTTGRVGLKVHLAVAVSFLLVGTTLGFLIFFALGGLATFAGSLLLLIGVLGWGSTVFYVGPPLKFAHRGVGEVVVGLSFG